MKFPFYKDVYDMFYIYTNFPQMILLDDKVRTENLIFFNKSSDTVFMETLMVYCANIIGSFFIF